MSNSENIGREIGLIEQKKLILEMMDAIDIFCREHHLKYFLGYGTLLGAVRHKGFIPWDDDFDIMMPREDYEKFISTFNMDPYRACDWSNTPEYYYQFAKVVDTRTVMFEKNVNTAMTLGAYIDVFPVDFLGDNIQDGYDLIKNRTKLWERLNTIKLMELHKEGRGMLKQLLVYLLKGLTACIPWRYILEKYNQEAMFFSQNKDSVYSAVTVCLLNQSEIFETKCYLNTQYYPFEDRNYCIPAGYDSILTALYGDYMKLPPENQRISPHHYQLYWKNDI